MLNKKKIETFINLSKKSGSCVFGVDNILKNKNIKLIIVSSDLSSNSKNKLFAKFGDDKIVETSEEFEGVLSQNIKAFAITNAELANTIKQNL